MLLTAPNFVNSELGDSIANVLFPRSVGIEFECELKPNTPVHLFRKIPHIMDVSCGNGEFEHRFRLPPGINGFKGLLEVSNLLTKYGIPTSSGLHYHTDMTDCYHKLSYQYIKLNEEWILQELDEWKYPGTYNRRNVYFDTSHGWIRFQYRYKTMECRIGEMTFDYEILIKRVLHLQTIAERLAYNAYSFANVAELEASLQPELDVLDLDEVRRTIANRMIS